MSTHDEVDKPLSDIDALHDLEPSAAPWRVEPFRDVAERLLSRIGSPPGRPVVIAVDGRGAGGKTTLAERFTSLDLAVCVIHTDDIAWNHAIMDWADLLVDGVLTPVHRGEAVSYRPPGWRAKGREGAVVVPAAIDLLVVEGVGSSRHALTPWYDATIWVQSGREAAKTRGIIRDGGSQDVIDFWDVWQAEEAPFFAADRPWERADLIVSGTPTIEHDPITEVVVSAR